MPALILSDTRILVGPLDVSTFTGSFSQGGTVNMVEGSVLRGGGFDRQYPGLRTHTTQLDGFADYDAGAIASVFTPADLGTQDLVTIMPTGGTAAADVALFGRQLIQNINTPGGNVGDMASFGMALQSDTPWIHGLVADPVTTRTTTANGPIFAMTGPTASQRVWFGLHVTAASGTTPSMTVTIQSATLVGFGSPTLRATFTAQTTPGWQFISVPGAVTDGFWRAVMTISGTTPSFTSTVVAGVL